MNCYWFQENDICNKCTCPKLRQTAPNGITIFPDCDDVCEDDMNYCESWEICTSRMNWEDIKKLDGIMDSMRTYTAWDAVDYPNDENFYKEVLKRFNEKK